eukprot:8932436-Alexandrium_andersonii.AAC.1
MPGPLFRAQARPPYCLQTRYQSRVSASEMLGPPFCLQAARRSHVSASEMPGPPFCVRAGGQSHMSASGAPSHVFASEVPDPRVCASYPQATCLRTRCRGKPLPASCRGRRFARHGGALEHRRFPKCPLRACRGSKRAQQR